MARLDEGLTLVAETDERLWEPLLRLTRARWLAATGDQADAAPSRRRARSPRRRGSTWSSAGTTRGSERGGAMTAAAGAWTDAELDQWRTVGDEPADAAVAAYFAAIDGAAPAAR